MNKQPNPADEGASRVNEKLKQLENSIQKFLEETETLFQDDSYYGIECAFILDHALNIKMHFYKQYPEFTQPHLQGAENTYERIVHIRENHPEDRLEQAITSSFRQK